MLRRSFLNQLEQLNKKVYDMGNKVDVIIGQTIDVLSNIDTELADKVIRDDTSINKMEHQIEQVCMNILALQQPIAGDLRMVAGCLKIITDIERIADQCTDICEIISMKQISKQNVSLNDVSNILKQVHDMFKRSINVFQSRNVDDAVNICKSDDNIDSLFSDIIFKICGVIAKDTSKIMPEVDLMFITKYAERMGDHCTNIAEWVIYMETGKHPALN